MKHNFTHIITKTIKAKIGLIGLLLFVVSNSFAQKHEVGIMLGGSFYMGDMNQLVPFKNTRPAGGLTYRNNINNRFAFKASGLFGYLYGSDATSHNQAQKNRNLNFKTHIAEISGQFEFNFLPYNTTEQDQWFTPYFFTGLSVFNFNPKGTNDGKWTELQKLDTESKKKAYFKTQIAIPVGLGIKMALNPHLTLGLEWGMRKTFTDYLDDLSGDYADPSVVGTKATPLADKSKYGNDGLNNYGRQRGNVNTKDWYSFFGATMSYKFHIYGDKCPSYN